MTKTTAIDALLAASATLADEEQDELLERLLQLRLARLASEQSEAERLVASLRRAHALVGGELTIAAYAGARSDLSAKGESIAPVSQLIRFFGSWRAAKDGLVLSDTNTARMIQERFRKRRLGKVWRYSEETLADVLCRCASEVGHPPLVVEFKWWRERELELARARDDDGFHLPSDSPYRARWGSWEEALRHFGFAEDEIAARLDSGRARSAAALVEHQFSRDGPARDI